jgi:hypothetical protein
MNRSGGVPTIAASAVAGVRHLLIQEKAWAGVRAELVRVHEGAASWIDSDLSIDPTKTAWVPAEHHAQMIDALRAVVGPERTFELGRERAHHTARAGAFAPVVRSWSRSFGETPSEFLKLTQHAWAAQTRNLGEFVLVEAKPGHARFVLRDADPVIAQSPGWKLFLSGYGTGLLDLVGRTGRCEIRLADNGDLEAIYEYTPA